MLILQCIIIFLSQSIDFINFFDQADIPRGEPVFIELPRYFNSDGVQCDVFLRLKKILHGQAESVRPCYENLQNGLFDHSFVAIKVDPCLFMSKNVISVVYVDDCLFWERSQCDIDNVMKSFKEYETIYNWQQSK